MCEIRRMTVELLSYGGRAESAAECLRAVAVSPCDDYANAGVTAE